MSHFTSTDLVNWTEEKVLDFATIPAKFFPSGWKRMVWNTSVDKGKLRGKEVWVMAFEWSDPTPRVGWNTLFATAQSIDGPWEVLRGAGLARDVSHANPTLRFYDDWWYVWTNRDTCGSQASPLDLSEIYRSRDLVTWEGPPGWSATSCPTSVLTPRQAQDARVVPAPWHPDTRPVVAKHAAELQNASDINNSDMDLVEYRNQTVLYYSWGDQQLGLTAMVLAVAEVDMAPGDWARSFW